MKVLIPILMTALCACGPASAAQPEVGGGTAGAIRLADDGTGTARFVMRWHSRRGRQRAVAIVSLPYADGFNLAVELRPTGGEGRKVSGDEVDLAIDARAVCAHRECDMEAIGTILVSSTEVTVAQTVNWSVLLAVEPVDAQVDLTDFTVEILEHDGGVASP